VLTAVHEVSLERLLEGGLLVVGLASFERGDELRAQGSAPLLLARRGLAGMPRGIEGESELMAADRVPLRAL
jgi:hypothetical protein